MAYGNNIVHEALKAGRARAVKRCVGGDDVRVAGSAECSSGRWSVSGYFFYSFFVVFRVNDATTRALLLLPHFFSTFCVLWCRCERVLRLCCWLFLRSLAALRGFYLECHTNSPNSRRGSPAACGRSCNDNVMSSVLLPKAYWRGA